MSNDRSELPKGIPAEPTEDAVSGYLAGLGPFYNKTKNEIALNESERKTFVKRSQNTTNRVTFSPVNEEIIIESSQTGLQWRETVQMYTKRILDEILPPRRRQVKIVKRRNSIVNQYRENKIGVIFVCLSIGLLSLSSVFLLISFFTKSWGIISENAKVIEPLEGNVHVENTFRFTWNFGLWMCCRNDGVCLSLKWPAWLIGYTFEKLLKYDLCTMVTLITLTVFTCICSTIAVITFGVYWGPYFQETFKSVTDCRKGYSFYLAILTVPLSASTAITLLIDLKSEWRLKEIKKKFGD